MMVVLQPVFGEIWDSWLRDILQIAMVDLAKACDILFGSIR